MVITARNKASDFKLRRWFKFHALYIPARLETLICVILAHGYTGEGNDMLEFARL